MGNTAVTPGRAFPSRSRAALLFSSAVALACAHGPPANHHAGYAMSQVAAAEVCAPAGEQVWLSRLRCPNGDQPKVVSREMLGTRHTPPPDDQRALKQLDFGLTLRPGEPDYHLVETFVVTCGAGDLALFLDMYHCTAPPPDDAPDGMTIVPLKPPPD